MSSLISQPKSFASLSSTLLARKGQARPAMRPQGFPGFGHVAEAIDDLGWNDMGPNDQGIATPMPVPPVLRQREVLKEEFEASAPSAPVLAAAALPASVPAAAAPVAVPVDEPHPVVAEVRHPVVRAPAGSKAKAAFTLRLDHERHLRLRLASASTNRSAQQLVTEALDKYLHALPEIEPLARQLAVRAKNDVDLGD